MNPKTKRKMPHSDDLKTNGKFDKEKFKASATAANEALASGDPGVHKIVIEQTKSGLVIQTKRTHGGKDGIINPAFVAMLQETLVMADADGVIDITDMRESGDKAGRDDLVIEAV